MTIIEKIRAFSAQFDSPEMEGIKEVLRWMVLFAVSWFIAETMKQISVVPEHAVLQVWVFSYSIPARSMLVFSLTFLGRYVDKYLYVKTKDKKNVDTQGLLPF